MSILRFAVTALLTSSLYALAVTNVSAQNLAGQVPDMQQTSSASGIPLQISFRDIRYQGQVRKLDVRPQSGTDVYSVFAQLHNVSFAIGSTTIRGSIVGAECGPLQIRMGTQRDITVNFQVKVQGSELTVVGTDFSLSDDNWQIGAPQWVKTRGIGATRERVVNGLRSGLKQKRYAVENLLRQEGTDLMQQLRTEVLANIKSPTAEQAIVKADKSEGQAAIAKKDAPADTSQTVDSQTRVETHNVNLVSQTLDFQASQATQDGRMENMDSPNRAMPCLPRPRPLRFLAMLFGRL